MNLIIFTTPLDARCELRLDDSGVVVVAVPATHPSGRPGQGFAIPDATPNGHGSQLTITAPGYVSLVQRAILWLKDGAATFAADDFRLTPTGGNTSLGRLEPDGDQLRVNGKPWVWAMMTGFCDYKLWLEGRRDELHAVWAQARDLGANGRRVFGMMHYITRFYPQEHANYLPELRPFAADAATYGQRIHFDVFADNQEVKLGNPFWEQVRAQYEPIASVLLGLGNEWPKNGFDPNAFSRPGVFSSQGSTTSDAAPPMPGWGLRCWHGRRDYPKVFMSSDDMVYVSRGLDESGHQYAPLAPIVHDEPMGFAEVSIPNRRSTDPRLAQSLMLGARAHGAGGSFHSEDGMFSRPLGPIQQTCARAFFDAQG